MVLNNIVAALVAWKGLSPMSHPDVSAPWSVRGHPPLPPPLQQTTGYPLIYRLAQVQWRDCE